MACAAMSRETMLRVGTEPATGYPSGGKAHSASRACG